MTATKPDAASTVTRQAWLDVLRVVAVIGVVAIHVFAAVVSNPARRGSAGWWVAVAFDLGNVWVVPVFVMVSGALLLGERAHARGVGHFYRTRLLRLAPAFVVWQAVYLFVVAPALAGTTVSPRSVMISLAGGTTFTHLYFLWLIVGLYAIAPVLAAFLRDGGRRRALVFAAAVLVVTTVAYSSSSLMSHLGSARPLNLVAVTQWLPYVGYFLAGWALRDVVLRGARAVAVAGLTLVALAEVVWQYGVRPAHPLLQAVAPVSYLGPVVVLASVGVFLTAAALLARWRPSPRIAVPLRTVSDAAFGVFLVHFALLLLARTVPGVEEATRSSVVAAAVLWLVIVVVSFAVVIPARRVPYLRRIF